ncbi:MULTISPECIES: Lrp/AsnC family transcriptional regulator [unclassified Caulobacter]|jgi:Lrp/AsnC family transcriptional regulator of ectoine degradation|uniref:Lrp/AsnC family transcriptional regulator n=1 Tax=unclassified Caulobacter TaxID=2648921 RepID=UPI0007854D48|nr:MULTISPECIES: Lrp/AsnC family transcriptional regulator [unclassified Caulobacter]AZS19563.1 Lrp/AsnC family transcriptional regulator [Caulobacter sp. FWC26]
MSDQRKDLDRIDIKILALLQRQGRVTKAAMGELVGLSASRCWERMKRLEKSRIIRGYHAEVDLGRLAKLSTFIVQVKLTDYSYAKARTFEAGIVGLPNVIGCQAVLGDVDYLVTIAAFSIEHYQAIMERMLDTLNVSFDYVTLPVTKTLKGDGDLDLPALLATSQDLEA